MRHKDTIGLFDYWNDLRAGRDAPPRSEVSPAALGRLLPSVMLLECSSDENIAVRLAGTKLCTLCCGELKGRALAKLFRPVDQVTVEKILATVARGTAIVVIDVMARTDSGSGIALEMVFLPLDDENTPILGVAAPLSNAYWIGVDPVEFELRGIRYMDPDADLVYLQNRPSVPMPDRERRSPRVPARGFEVIVGSGIRGRKQALRAFRVLDGGKK